MKQIILLITFLFICIAGSFGQQKGESFPTWVDGELEIHHISTGKGEAVFCIFPDGTTMLIDAGDTGSSPDPRVTSGLPDESRQPGEWIARYITSRLPFPEKKEIDYVFLTHFHGDHMGSPSADSPKTRKGGDYLLSGLSEVAEYLDFKKMVDRNWPGYDYPKPQTGKAFENYLSFLTWNNHHTGMKTEGFIPGTNEQFVLVHNPSKYSGMFQVRNIVANGEVWTGDGNETRCYFPVKFTGGESIDENKLSAGIRISYGEFDYFNGGDISGKLPFNADTWRNIERPVGEAVGPVEVCEANHHGWIDAMSDYFISCVRPQVFIIQVWHVTHLGLEVIRDMSSRGLYPGDRDIFPTKIPEITKSYIGEENVKKLTGDGGHVVVKVEPGGNKFHIFLINDTDESFTVKSVYGPYECRSGKPAK